MLLSPHFFVVDRLHEAAGNRERAEILLRLSDAVIVPFAQELILACKQERFGAGAAFLIVRDAAHSASRDAHGLLPAHLAEELELWRDALSRYAAGEGHDGD